MWLSVMLFHVNYWKVTTWFLMQFDVISTCKFFQKQQIALTLQACAILLSLKNLPVLVNTKLHWKHVITYTNFVGSNLVNCFVSSGTSASVDALATNMASLKLGLHSHDGAPQVLKLLDENLQWNDAALEVNLWTMTENFIQYIQLWCFFLL